MQDLKEVFNADIHPLVQQGILTRENVVAEFMDNFYQWYQTGFILKQDWDYYYSVVSLQIENDDHFIQLLRTLWRLN